MKKKPALKDISNNEIVKQKPNNNVDKQPAKLIM